MTPFLIMLGLLGLAVFLLLRDRKQNRIKIEGVPASWRKILYEKVTFYRSLPEGEKKRFETNVLAFLNQVGISGVQTTVTLEDRLLVAASAVIPLFGFPGMSYHHLDEVLLYPGAFDRNYRLGNPEEIITGMVGEGPMDGKVIFSKPALHAGFDINTDKKNVGIHEFVHLFDKEDGYIDGIPPTFEDKRFSLPWLDLVQKQTKEIIANRSDIDDYATYNREEFFAVAGEYFFERPDLLEKKHPDLFTAMKEVFHQDPGEVITPNALKAPHEIGRNDPCICGSGKKYKECCGR